MRVVIASQEGHSRKTYKQCADYTDIWSTETRLRVKTPKQ